VERPEYSAAKFGQFSYKRDEKGKNFNKIVSLLLSFPNSSEVSKKFVIFPLTGKKVFFS
jgi:hypothetical protein